MVAICGGTNSNCTLNTLFAFGITELSVKKFGISYAPLSSFFSVIIEKVFSLSISTIPVIPIKFGHFVRTTKNTLKKKRLVCIFTFDDSAMKISLDKSRV